MNTYFNENFFHANYWNEDYWIDGEGEGVAPEVGGGGKSKKKRQEEYDKAYKLAQWRKEQREAIQQAVEAEISAKQGKDKQTLRLKKKALKQPEISQSEVRQLAIEYQLNYLEFKHKENEALAILLLVS